MSTSSSYSASASAPSSLARVHELAMIPLIGCSHKYSWLPWDARSWSELLRLSNTLRRLRSLPWDRRPRPGSIVVVMPNDEVIVEGALGLSLGSIPLIGESEPEAETDRRSTALFNLAKLALTADTPAMCVYTREHGMHAMCVPSFGDLPLDEVAVARLAEAFPEASDPERVHDVLGMVDPNMLDASASERIFTARLVELASE